MNKMQLSTRLKTPDCFHTCVTELNQSAFSVKSNVEIAVNRRVCQHVR